MATAEIRARATLDKASFDAGISAMQRSAVNLRNVIAGAFSAGALTSFVRSSMNYAAQFEDMSDQFGLTASQLSGLDQAFKAVGGSSQNLEASLRSLKTKATENGVTMQEYVSSVIDAYRTTNDFSALVDEVGVRNAAKFAAAIRELSGDFKDLKGPVDSATAALSDFYGDMLARQTNVIKGITAKASADLFTFLEASGKWFMESLKYGGEIGPANEAFKKVYADQRAMFQEKQELRRQVAELEKQAAQDAIASTGMSDPLSGLRSIIGAIAGAQGAVVNMAGSLSGMRAMKKPSQEIEREERIRYDALRRIGGNLPGGATDPQRKAAEKLVDLTKQLLDEAKKANGKNGAGARF